MIINHYSFDPTFTFWYFQEVQRLPSEALLKVMRPHTEASVSPQEKIFPKLGLIMANTIE